MSRGPGKVQRGIEAAFQNAEEGQAFSVKTLACEIFYDEDDDTSPSRSELVSVRRAVKKVAERLGWKFMVTVGHGGRGNSHIYFNPKDEASRRRALKMAFPLVADEFLESAAARRAKALA
jgi:hypothetical protein